MSGDAPEDLGDEIVQLLIRLCESWVTSARAAQGLQNGTMSRRESLAQANTSGRQSAEINAELKSRLSPTDWAVLESMLEKRGPREGAPSGFGLQHLVQKSQKLGFAHSMWHAVMQARNMEERRSGLRAERARIKTAALEEKARAAEKARVKKHEDKERDRAQREEAERRLAELGQECKAQFDINWLDAEDWYQSLSAEDAKILTPERFERARIDFVIAWAQKNLKEKLDRQQAAAVGAAGGHLRVAARAGSGKTRTLVTRALFLEFHIGIPPGCLLLVAFNKKAVKEIRERLTAKRTKLTGKGASGVGPGPHVVTFHALAYALTQRADRLIFDDPEREAPEQSQTVKRVIDTFLEVAEKRNAVRAAMEGYFREDWERILVHGLQLSDREKEVLSRGLTSETLGRDFVRSGGERLIANILFTHEVNYFYERARFVGGALVRPDFTVARDGKDVGLIEYLGSAGDTKYDETTSRKMTLYDGQQLPVLYLYRSSIRAGEAALTGELTGWLGLLGIKTRQLTRDEVWDRIRERAVDRFSITVKGFIGRARTAGMSVDALKDQIESHATVGSERAFLDLAADVYRDYLQHLTREGLEDFQGLVWRATDEIRDGRTRFTRDGGTRRGDLAAIQHVLIDEFQDFSPMFHELIRRVLAVSDGATVFAVGDDWQAINEFAGSEPTYFLDFEKYFPDGKTLELLRNYRSPAGIVTLSNTVMAGRGRAAEAGTSGEAEVIYLDVDQLQPTSAEMRIWNDNATPALARVIHWALQTTQGGVAVLYRRTAIPWGARRGHLLQADVFASRLMSYFDQADRARVEVTTAHKYKGREAQTVIIADADDRSYPLIHPSSVLYRLFGDTPELEDAERRLFYVAVTRSMSRLVFLASGETRTRFLGTNAVARHDWGRFPSPIVSDVNVLQIRVYNGFGVKDRLLAMGFEWEGRSRSWQCAISRQNADPPAIKRTLEFASKYRSELRDDNGDVVDVLWPGRGGSPAPQAASPPG